MPVFHYVHWMFWFTIHSSQQLFCSLVGLLAHSLEDGDLLGANLLCKRYQKSQRCHKKEQRKPGLG
jgi:hypothetical protein